MNLRSFNSFGDYLNSLTLSNVCELSWSWIPIETYSSLETETNFCLRLFLSSIKLTVKLVQKMSCTCKVFLLLILKTASSVLSSCRTMSISEYVGDHCLTEIEVRKYFNTYLLFVIKVVLYMLSARVLKQNFK